MTIQYFTGTTTGTVQVVNTSYVLKDAVHDAYPVAIEFYSLDAAKSPDLYVDGIVLAWLDKDIAATPAAPYGTGAAIYSVDGVTAAAAEGELHGAEGSSIYVSETGKVIGSEVGTAAVVDAIRMVGAQTLTNEGTVTGDSSGVNVAHGAATKIVNHGLIEGKQIGIFGASPSSDIKVHNSGTITGVVAMDFKGADTTISNLGEVHGLGGYAIRAFEGHTTVRNSGDILTTDAFSNSIQLYESFQIENSGLINPGISGVSVSSGNIYNSGEILSNFSAIDVSADPESSGSLVIDNAGTIRGDVNAITLSGATGKITTSGQIFGTINLDSSAVYFGNDALDNFGLIVGDIFGGLGDDTLTNMDRIEGEFTGNEGADQFLNHGTFIGDVYADGLNGEIAFDDIVLNAGRVMGQIDMGGGADIFDGRGGSVEGGVFGGADDDTYIIDNNKADLHELLDGGTDLVKAYTHHKLEAHFENLELKGIEHLRGVGNSEANALTGNDGNNILKGRAGNDTLAGGDGDDLLRGGAGADNLAGGDDDDRLISGAGNDLLNGDAGDDLLRGGKGKDTLNGGVDDDTLIGGRGADILIGGYGDDVFKFTKASDNNAGSGYDRINDFARGQDLIDLSALGVTLSIGGTLTGGSRQAITTEVSATHTRLFIDMDRDGSADMRIDVRNTLNMTVDDFIL